MISELPNWLQKLWDIDKSLARKAEKDYLNQYVYIILDNTEQFISVHRDENFAREKKNQYERSFEYLTFKILKVKINER